MQLINRLFLGLISFILSGTLFLSCGGKKIFIPEEPDGIVCRLIIRQSIGNEEDLIRLMEEETVESGDSLIYGVVKVLNLSQKGILHWQWYNPQGELVKKSELISINREGRFLEYFIAWDSLENKYFKDHPGIWQVAIYLNNQFLNSKSFSISSSPSQTSGSPNPKAEFKNQIE